MQAFLERLLAHMGVEDVKIELEEAEGDQVINVRLNVKEEDSGLLIGVRGETLSALQRMLFLSFREELKEKKIYLHINDYLEKKEEKLRGFVERAIEEVEQGRAQYRFHFLSPRERMMIHTLVSQDTAFQQYETFSEGEGNDRRLFLKKKQQES
jgi:spoIIIJ-associated protein